MRLNRVRVIPGRGCVCGVVGRVCRGLPTTGMRLGVSGSIWDGAPKWVISPVREGIVVVCGHVPE